MARIARRIGIFKEAKPSQISAVTPSSPHLTSSNEDFPCQRVQDLDFELFDAERVVHRNRQQAQAAMENLQQALLDEQEQHLNLREGNENEVKSLLDELNELQKGKSDLMEGIREEIISQELGLVDARAIICRLERLQDDKVKKAYAININLLGMRRDLRASTKRIEGLEIECREYTVKT